MKLKKKWLQKKALDGGSKVAALSDAASSSVIAVPGEGVVAAAPIEDTKPTGDADLVGQLARVIDDTLGFGVAGEMVEILSVVGNQILARVQKARGSKLGRNVCLKTSQFALRSKLPVPKPSKKMLFSQDDRVELDMKFDAEELGKSIALTKDSRLASMHLNMLWWSIQRDLEIENKQEICYLDPEISAQICYQMKLPDCETSMEEAFAMLTCKIGTAKMVFAPIWGGTDGSEHWTLLIFEKNQFASFEQVAKDEWRATYKDSLSQMCKSCYSTVQIICTLLSMAVGHYIKMPEDRCNGALQRVGSGTCGYYVMHWVEEACRRQLGEGEMANGYADLSKMLKRLEVMTNQILKNKGIAALKSVKIEAKRLKVAEALEAMTIMAKKLAASESFQLEAAKKTVTFKFTTWASSGGCSKCRFAKFGSTCCNPDKKEALQRACQLKKEQMEKDGKAYTDGEHCSKVYKECLEEVYKEIAVKRCLPDVPSLSKPGGGQVLVVNMKRGPR